MEKGALPAELVKEAIARIVASPTFGRAPRASDLLRGIVGMVLAGRESELKEYTLAAEIFGKTGYDPKVDSVVRVEASRLRALLVKYYEGEGVADPVRIEIPKGSYAPRIAMIAPAPVAAEAKRTRAGAGIAMAGAVFAALILFWVWPRERPPQVAPRPSIGVMPFVDLTADQDGGRFADGLTQEITNALAKWNGVEVASFTSVQQYKSRPADVRRVGRELGLHAVLEGSVRRDGDKLRVSARFTSTRSGFGIWSQDWNRDAADPLTVQSDIANRIVVYLKYDMHGTRRALVLPPAGNMEAWNHYLRGVRTAEEEIGVPGGRAGEMFRAAVGADPQYALGWATLAKWHCQQFEWGFDGRAALDHAVEAARRAVAVDRWLPEAHEAEGRVRVLRDYDWKGAEKALRRAIDIEPAHVDALFGYARLVLGPQCRFQEAIGLMRRALQVDETRFDVHGEIVSALIRSGRLADAREELERSRVKGSPMADLLAGRILAASGKPEEALPFFERASRRNRGKWTLGYYGYGLAAASRPGEARGVLREMAELPNSALERAMILVKLGDRTQALELIAQAEKEGANGMLWAKADERLTELKEDARFGEVVRRLGL